MHIPIILHLDSRGIYIYINDLSSTALEFSFPFLDLILRSELHNFFQNLSNQIGVDISVQPNPDPSYLGKKKKKPKWAGLHGWASHAGVLFSFIWVIVVEPGSEKTNSSLSGPDRIYNVLGKIILLSVLSLPESRERPFNLSLLGRLKQHW